jgi:hypothetical protein
VSVFDRDKAKFFPLATEIDGCYAANFMSYKRLCELLDEYECRVDHRGDRTERVAAIKFDDRGLTIKFERT